MLSVGCACFRPTETASATSAKVILVLLFYYSSNRCRKTHRVIEMLRTYFALAATLLAVGADGAHHPSL